MAEMVKKEWFSRLNSPFWAKTKKLAELGLFWTVKSV
jgi:hypothetical protein